LNDYTIERKIGKGQFSVVYKAIRNKDNQAVALKKIPVLTCIIIINPLDSDNDG
jgi:serine/threonine protein kinase